LEETLEGNILRIAGLNSAIYRIFSLTRFQQILQNNELVLVNPSVWEDPFEAFLMNKIVHLPNNEKANLDPIKERVFGQCWMSCSESDAMWRIYSYPSNPAPNYEVGVKVKTTVNKLFTAFWNVKNNQPEFGPLRYWIGRVRYLSFREIKRITNDEGEFWGYFADATGKGLAEAHLIKRKEFLHEKEIRLLYCAPNGYAEPRFHFPVNPNNLISEVILDPRLTDAAAAALKLQIEGWGYTGKIKKSDLYLPPRYHVGMNMA
jgi:hypothetical protein